MLRRGQAVTARVTGHRIMRVKTRVLTVWGTKDAACVRGSSGLSVPIRPTVPKAYRKDVRIGLHIIVKNAPEWGTSVPTVLISHVRTTTVEKVSVMATVRAVTVRREAVTVRREAATAKGATTAKGVTDVTIIMVAVRTAMAAVTRMSAAAVRVVSTRRGAEGSIARSKADTAITVSVPSVRNSAARLATTPMRSTA